jgi:hypothetical protein
MINDLERIQKEAAVANLRHYFGIPLEGPRQNTKTCHETESPG